MAQYATIHSTGQMTSSHRFLIGPPLLIVAAFCFVFVLVKPQTSTRTEHAASNQSIPRYSSSRTKLPTLHTDNQTSLTKLMPEPAATISNSVSNTTPAAPLVTLTANAQSSSAAASSLQSAGQNNLSTANDKSPSQTKTSIKPIINTLDKLTIIK